MKPEGTCAVSWCPEDVVRDARFCRPHLDDWYCLRLHALPDGTFIGTAAPEARQEARWRTWTRENNVAKDLTRAA